MKKQLKKLKLPRVPVPKPTRPHRSTKKRAEQDAAIREIRNALRVLYRLDYIK